MPPSSLASGIEFGDEIGWQRRDAPAAPTNVDAHGRAAGKTAREKESGGTKLGDWAAAAKQRDTGTSDESVEAIALAERALRDVIKGDGAAYGSGGGGGHSHEWKDREGVARASAQTLGMGLGHGGGGGGQHGVLEPRDLEDEEATVYDKVIHLQREKLKELQRDKERAEKAARQAQEAADAKAAAAEKAMSMSQRRGGAGEQSMGAGARRGGGGVEEELMRCGGQPPFCSLSSLFCFPKGLSIHWACNSQTCCARCASRRFDSHSDARVEGWGFRRVRLMA